MKIMSKVKLDQKKGVRQKLNGFSLRMWMETQFIEIKSLHHKSLKLWFYIIKWRHPKWCHPKMVTPGASPFRPLSDATGGAITSPPGYASVRGPGQSQNPHFQPLTSF